VGRAFAALLLVKALRPDRVVEIAGRFVEAVLGAGFLQKPELDWRDLLAVRRLAMVAECGEGD
jgi:hypothetical protein